MPCPIELQRLRYWQGQLLRSRDFRDQMDVEAQLRWWHNRSLHDAFGVSFGLKASPVYADDGNGSLIAVRLTCGLAYDCFGRELILQETRKIAVPDSEGRKASGMTLLIRHKETALYQKRSDRGEACLPGCDSTFQEEPEFLWRPSDCVKATDGVPLAVVNYETLQGEDESVKTLRWQDEFVAPVSRPLARPRVASGMTIPGNTPWELWRVSVPGKGDVTVGVQTRIDTSTAGFTRKPCYFAWLQGPLFDLENHVYIPTPFPSITDASTEGFTFRLLMPKLAVGESVLDIPDSVINEIAEDGLSISVENAARFNIGDEVAIGETERATIKDINVEENKITLDRRIPEGNLGRILRPVRFGPEQGEVRLETGFRVTGRVIERLESGGISEGVLNRLRELTAKPTGSGEGEFRTALETALEGIEEIDGDTVDSIVREAGLMRTTGLLPGSEVVVIGDDPDIPGTTVTVPRIVTEVDRSEGFVTFSPGAERGAPVNKAFDNPRIQIVTNGNFEDEFFLHARKQGLYVCWFGCQKEDALPVDCPERPGIETLCP
ncbi:MAG: hypothetical protein L0229_02510 [Blastocatellia bacterium]|nr:hypothetical protein [Blastocatellia bacterium]